MKPALRAFHRWMRPVLPPASEWGVYLLLYLAMAGGYHAALALQRATRVDFPVYLWFLIVAAVYYGFSRGVARHPAHDAAYREWLRLMPWSPRRQPPLGPVLPAWQDLIVLAVLLGLAAEGGTRLPPIVLAATLAAWLAVSVISLQNMESLGGAWAVAWGLGLAIRVLPDPGRVNLVLIPLTAVAALAQRRAIARYPWHRVAPSRPLADHPAARQAFPLAARPRQDSISVGQCLALSLLCGWLGYAAMGSAINDTLRRAYGGELIATSLPWLFFVIASVALSLGRLGLYASVLRPPLSLAGRLATGRLIIPGYDRILLAPALTLGLGGVFIFRLLERPGISPPGFAAEAALLVFCALAPGPTLRRWQLTGQGRAVYGNVKTARELFADLKNNLKNMNTRKAPARTPPGLHNLRLPVFLGSWVRGNYGRLVLEHTLILLAGCAVVNLFLWRNNPLLAGPGVCAMILTFVVYPLRRAADFHPLFNQKYLSWLRLTPWRPGRPLPLGPVQLTWLDLAFVAAFELLLGLTAFHFLSRTPLTMPANLGRILTVLELGSLVVFLLLHAAGVLRVLLRAAEFGCALALGALFGLQVLLAPRLGPMLALGLGMAALGAWGLHRSWRGYPWDGNWFSRFSNNPSSVQDIYVELRRVLLREADGAAKVSPLNFVLSAKVRPEVMTRPHRLGLILLTGWWVFCLAHAARLPADVRWGCGSFGLVGTLVFGVTVRLKMYRQYSRSPLGFWGRLLTLRWIIPGYDRIFAAPLAALAVAAVSIIALTWAGAPPEALALVWIACWAVLLLGGPSLGDWRLTGAGRLPPRIKNEP